MKKSLSALLGVSLLVSGLTLGAESSYAESSTNSNVKKATQQLNPTIQIPASKVKKKEKNLFSGSSKKETRRGKITEADAKRGYIKDEIIVKFKTNKSLSSLGDKIKVKGLKLNKTLDKKLGIQTLKFDTNVSTMKEILKVLNASSAVEYAEPNYIYKPAAVSEPYYQYMWGLKNTGQYIDGAAGKKGIDINAESAWVKTKGSASTTVAVIDTGVDIYHPDLKDNIWKNPGEIAGDGIDNDRNGYIDDVNGWDFYYDDDEVYYDEEYDAHGTHVAGTIGAKENSTGVIGVAPNVKIMSLKFIGPDGGSTDGAIAAINYAKSKGVKVSNNSWGGGEYSQALYDVIKSSNSTFIAAAGNDGDNIDSYPAYPAAYDLPNIVSVAAIDNQGNLDDFSNYGSKNVDVAAPGVSVLSTIPENSYAYGDGTSMAAPHVTGVASLVLAANPSFSSAQLKDTLMKSTTKLSSLTGKVASGGLVNAGLAVSADIDGEIPGVSLNGNSISSTLNASTDKDDVYSIKLTKGEKFTVSLSGAAGTDFDLYLYNQNAKTVNSSDGIVAYSEKLNTSSETLTFVASADGTYYLDVYAYKGSGSYKVDVKYGATAGVYEDTSTNLAYTGNWSKVSNSSSSGGSYKAVNEANASMQFVFNGTEVSLNTLKDNTQGQAKVTLDGTAYWVDLYADKPQYKATVFNKKGLKAGKHTLKVEWSGKVHPGAKKTVTKVTLDSITVK